MSFTFSDRLASLPPYVFSEINRLKAEAQKRGSELLSLAIGDPDQPTPLAIVEKQVEASRRPENHLYSPYEGSANFREAVRDFCQSRFGVPLDPSREIIALIGSKEGLAHFPLAFCNPGDKALYPSPGYPIFQTSLLMAGAEAIAYPLMAKDGFLPDLNVLESLLSQHRPKYLLLNFPSNPTSALCSREVLTEIVALAKKFQVILGYDNAYSEIYYEESKRPVSLMEIPGAKEVGIEFHSLSKTFNMTGWRLGFAIGNAQLVEGLLKVKTNTDSGPLLSVQSAGAFALKEYQRLCPPIRRIYAERREAMLTGLNALGIEYLKPEATFFVWARVPHQIPSMEFTKALIENHGLVVTPGAGFGKEGEHFFRLSLTVSPQQISQALERLESYLKEQNSSLGLSD
jgi:LL-diaminopimelate aminotransferase